MSKLTVNELKSTVDEWVREMNSKVTGLSEVPDVLVENTNNIQHNYERIKELQSQVDQMREELTLIRMLCVNMLKERQTIKN